MLMRAEEIQIDLLGRMLSVTLSCGFQRELQSHNHRKRLQLLDRDYSSGFVMIYVDAGL